MVVEAFFIVPVPVPLPLPDLCSGNRRSYIDSDGRHPSFRGLLSDPVSGTGTGTGTGARHAGTAEPLGVHGRRP